MPTSPLLERLIWSSKTNSKAQSKEMKCRKFSLLSNKKKIVTSTNCDTSNPSIPTIKLHTTPLWEPLLNILLNKSKTKVNKKEDRGSPCLMLPPKWVIKLPIHYNKKDTKDKHPQIHFLHLLPNLFQFIILSRDPLMLSESLAWRSDPYPFYILDPLLTHWQPSYHLESLNNEDALVFKNNVS